MTQIPGRSGLACTAPGIRVVQSTIEVKRMSSTARASAAHSFSSSDRPPDPEAEPAAAGGRYGARPAAVSHHRAFWDVAAARARRPRSCWPTICGRASWAKACRQEPSCRRKFELTRESGLGRATVREALRLLESEGLIAIRRGVQGGIEVTRPNLSQLSHSLAPDPDAVGSAAGRPHRLPDDRGARRGAVAAEQASETSGHGWSNSPSTVPAAATRTRSLSCPPGRMRRQ